MIFTDDELKQLKEGLKGSNYFSYYLDERSGKLPNILAALLARLEAAENFIGGRTVICGGCENVISSTPTDESLYKAWRASRGEAWDGNIWCRTVRK